MQHRIPLLRHWMACSTGAAAGYRGDARQGGRGRRALYGSRVSGCCRLSEAWRWDPVRHGLPHDWHRIPCDVVARARRRETARQSARQSTPRPTGPCAESKARTLAARRQAGADRRHAPASADAAHPRRHPQTTLQPSGPCEGSTGRTRSTPRQAPSLRKRAGSSLRVRFIILAASMNVHGTHPPCRTHNQTYARALARTCERCAARARGAHEAADAPADEPEPESWWNGTASAVRRWHCCCDPRLSKRGPPRSCRSQPYTM